MDSSKEKNLAIETVECLVLLLATTLVAQKESVMDLTRVELSEGSSVETRVVQKVLRKADMWVASMETLKAV